MDSQKFELQRDLYAARSQFKNLVDTGILSSEGTRTPWFEPVITHLLILLSDLLKAADQLGHRCNFSEDILCVDPRIGSEINDVTDLIIKCRNSSCHISSKNMIFDTNKFKFCVIVGFNPSCFDINGKKMGCDYHDDIAVFWGPMRLYLKRNMMRAFAQIAPLFPDPYSHPSPPTNFSNR